MLAVKAHVEQGRLKLDEPTSLPEGEVVELVPIDEVLAAGGDCLDDDERKALHAALDEAEADIEAGRVISEEEVWATLRAIK
jgi:predicted DNA-binding antitoxin AbrB/MazE fold protein